MGWGVGKWGDECSVNLEDGERLELIKMDNQALVMFGRCALSFVD